MSVESGSLKMNRDDLLLALHDAIITEETLEDGEILVSMTFDSQEEWQKVEKALCDAVPCYAACTYTYGNGDTCGLYPFEHNPKQWGYPDHEFVIHEIYSSPHIPFLNRD
jgi:hypothetical protein